MWSVGRLKQQCCSFPLFSPVAELTQRKLLVWSEGESDRLCFSLCVSGESDEGRSFVRSPLLITVASHVTQGCVSVQMTADTTAMFLFNSSLNVVEFSG